MKFRECGEWLRGRRFSLRMKGIVYRSCVRSEMLYGSETWCFRESEMAILRRTERAMVRLMCGVKLVDRKKMEELMEMLGLKETLDRMAKANGVRWYGPVAYAGFLNGGVSVTSHRDDASLCDVTAIIMPERKQSRYYNKSLVSLATHSQSRLNSFQTVKTHFCIALPRHPDFIFGLGREVFVGFGNCVASAPPVLSLALIWESAKRQISHTQVFRRLVERVRHPGNTWVD